ncbi:ATP synthase F1 subunit gamma [Ferroacidibacillus organovorans]|uniref:ATP synthase gamma chain n=1 Tax=Ferroacidibacillus organovorans TaxID=1765683 RepID=A0A853KCB2_9BACL|nr:ATP synthase F1 subunit gamma [Ferroacidibacillus organovorans]KYP81462.1 F0F1 ATP synthase subunit gamma [Ferroacidibacillus organovorans]OAG93994.1 F0F1 ATP synthase subunit gamma [Ferroacidibacillus organovorans]
MPQNTRDIRRRIKSVQNTAQITKAMEMVAAAKLRRVQEAVQLSKPYLQKLQEMLADLAPSVRSVKHPMLAARPVRKTGYLVVTSDRGLAGPYNSNVIRKALQEFRDKDKDTYTVFAVGRKGRDFFRRMNYPLGGEAVGLSDAPTYGLIKPLAEQVIEAYASEQFDELYLVYNEFINAVTQQTVVKKVLPLTDLAGDREPRRVNFIFEPDEQALLAKLLPRYAETLVFQSVLDAKASEHGSRMTAMGNATDAAKDMIGTLTLTLNRARQAAITTQIAEVVGGAEALK